MLNTFSNICHLFSVCVCACVPLQEVNGKVAGTFGGSVSKFCRVRMQKEFPADYTEVKQGGPDKERKISPVPHHANATLTEQNSQAKLQTDDRNKSCRLRKLDNIRYPS